MLRCAGREWGDRLPTSAATIAAQLHPLVRRVCVITDMVHDILVKELCESLQVWSPSLCVVNDVTSATHALVILSDGLVEDGAACRMLEAAAVKKEVKTVFIYSTKHGWDFESFYYRPDSPVKAAIAEHEAMAHRPREALPRPGGYEFDAVCLELLRRMRPSAR